jgi:hypothetical protein
MWGRNFGLLQAFNLTRLRKSTQAGEVKGVK